MAPEIDIDRMHPKNNPILVGQDDAERQFLSDFASGRLHHTWLITGPKGIGKATLAYRVARFILSKSAFQRQSEISLFDEKSDLDAENKEENYREKLYVPPESLIFNSISLGTNPDFLSLERLLDPQSKKFNNNIPIGNMTNPEKNSARFLTNFLRKTVSNGGYRVAIIDAVDDLREDAQNALLKTIENPPSYSLLLLVSHNPTRLLSTIRSRCRLLRLFPLSKKNTGEIINYFNIELDEYDLDSLYSISNGSVGNLIDVVDSAGIEVFRLTNDIFIDPMSLNTQVLEKLLSLVAKDRTGKAFKTVHILLSHWLAEKAKREAAGSVVNNFGRDQWVSLWRDMNHLFRQTENVNLDKKQTIFTTFMKISSLCRAYS